jgi:hypothetical protein
MKKAGARLAAPADTNVVRTMREQLPAGVPYDYFEFLLRHNGGDIWPDETAWNGRGFDYLRLNSVEEMLEDKKRG